MTGETPMFEVPAEGELFDCRPFESDGPAPGGRDLPASSWRCPACGEANEVSPGATCPRCEQAGHVALTMEVDSE